MIKNLMKPIVFPLGLLLAVFCSCNIVTAQEVIASAGSSNSTASGSISWTIGESTIETYTMGNVSITQGVHQSNFTVTGLTPSTEIRFDLNVFPNPTTDFLKIESDEKGNISYSLRIYKADGALIYESEMTEETMSIDFTSIYPGEYFLHISDSNQHINTYKIIKH